MNFRKKDNFMKKIVDDVSSSHQDVFNLNPAFSMVIKRSPSPNKKTQLKRDKSDASTVSEAMIDSDERHGLKNLSSEIVKSYEDIKDSKKLVSKPSDKFKKKSWYNVIFKDYKSRSEEFKKLFNIPDDERLLVDFSCAIQKDILVHGRLYVSQNYICFHANIIVYETRFLLKWKDVKSISKEKMAKVIPNAILISTEGEKHFLTSFTSRDKTYLMLFRVWQNALMDTPMNSQELWQWVHTCYGEHLGLTSDDEDYIDPSKYEEPDLINSADSVSEGPDNKISSSSSNKLTEDFCKTKKEFKKVKKTYKEITEPNIKSIEAQSLLNTDLLPTDMSDSSISDGGSKMEMINDAECNSMHEGRQLVHTILPLNIETVFSLLFRKSKFFSEFHKMRKTTNLIQGEWEQQSDGTQKRVQTLTVCVGPNILVGPKISHVTETQTMRSCSKPGFLYSIDAVSENAGIPYADSFYVLLHYCMKRTSSDDSTVMSVHASIIYKKSVWGVVKGFIEKNTWIGLEDFYDALSQALLKEYNIPPAKSKKRRTRKSGHSNQILPNLQASSLPSKPTHNDEIQLSKQMHAQKSKHVENIGETKIELINNRQEKLSWVVVILLFLLISFNVILYFKLWEIEDSEKYEIILNKPSSKTQNPLEWLKLLKIQEKLHLKEMQKWQEVIHSAVELLKKTESSLSELQKLISYYRSKSSSSDHHEDDSSNY